jgi:hypothetical protein
MLAWRSGLARRFPKSKVVSSTLTVGFFFGVFVFVHALSVLSFTLRKVAITIPANECCVSCCRPQVVTLALSCTEQSVLCQTHCMHSGDITGDDTVACSDSPARSRFGVHKLRSCVADCPRDGCLRGGPSALRLSDPALQWPPLIDRWSESVDADCTTGMYERRSSPARRRW